MKKEWELLGEVEYGLVTSLTLSPTYPRDRTVFAVSLAGISISRDGGTSWEKPGRGHLGPFIREVVLSPNYATDRQLHAVSPAGIFRSYDAGRSWVLAQDSRRVTGPIAVSPAGDLFVASAADGQIWRASRDSDTLQPGCRIGSEPLELAVTASPVSLWLLTSDGLLKSRDEGDSWEAVDLPVDDACQTMAACGSEMLAIGMEHSGLALRRAGGCWEVPEKLQGVRVNTVASDRDGRIIAAGTTRGVFVSFDAGCSWSVPRKELPVVTVAVAEGGSDLFIGAAAGGCMHSGDVGSTWTTLGGLNGTLISRLPSTQNHVVALTASGIMARSADGGRHWRPSPLTTEPEVVAADRDPEATTTAAVTPHSIILGSSVVVESPVERPLCCVAIVEQPERVLAVASRREVMVSHDDGKTWRADTPPLQGGASIVELGFGQPGRSGRSGLVVGTTDARGIGEAWIRLGRHPWRRVVSERAGAAGVQIATVAGPRGIFIGVGDYVYRPAQVGELLFAKEQPEPSAHRDVLQLTALGRPGREAILAVHTATGIGVSYDGGLIWDRLSPPSGPPVTAISLRPRGDKCQLLAAQVGGSILGRQL